MGPGHPPDEGPPPALTAEAVQKAVREQAGIELLISSRFRGNRLTLPFEILHPRGQPDAGFPSFRIVVYTPSDPELGRTRQHNPDGTQTETDGHGITWARPYAELGGEDYDYWGGVKWYGNVVLGLRAKTRTPPEAWHRIDQALTGVLQPPLM